jgi:hypothetical protein
MNQRERRVIYRTEIQINGCSINYRILPYSSISGDPSFLEILTSRAEGFPEPDLGMCRNYDKNVTLISELLRATYNKSTTDGASIFHHYIFTYLAFKKKHISGICFEYLPMLSDSRWSRNGPIELPIKEGKEKFYETRNKVNELLHHVVGIDEDFIKKFIDKYNSKLPLSKWKKNSF